jgi:hypothetical protein
LSEAAASEVATSEAAAPVEQAAQHPVGHAVTFEAGCSIGLHEGPLANRQATNKHHTNTLSADTALGQAHKPCHKEEAAPHAPTSPPLLDMEGLSSARFHLHPQLHSQLHSQLRPHTCTRGKDREAKMEIKRWRHKEVHG